MDSALPPYNHEAAPRRREIDRAADLPNAIEKLSARAQADWSARAARYRLVPPLAATSRLTVEAGRPKARAIARYDRPAARPREMSSRSSNRNRPAARRRGTGLIPPQRSR